jgi:histidinol-phosphate aminotransferase
VSIINLIRPEIRALRPYHAAEQVNDTIRLNANESPWTATDDHFRRPLNRYPEVRPSKLRSVLADRYGCNVSNLIVTRGTSEGIDLLTRVFCRSGQDAVLTLTPTFSMYRHYAQVQGARLIECPTSSDNDFAIDVDALLAACDEATRLLFICSPNNPTGNTVPLDDLIRILEARADKSAVVVDEAYIEYSEYASAVDLMQQFENLIVLRTMSKALACAGARCGSVLAATEIIAVLEAVQAPYALATPVVESVENSMQTDSLAEADRLAKAIAFARQNLMASVEQFQFVSKVWPSAANFFLIEVESADALLAHCSEQGILLRDFGGDLANCIRITVGSDSENSRLLLALKEFQEFS